MNRKFKRDDCVICIDGTGTVYDKGDVLVIKSDEAFSFHYNGYSVEGSEFIIPFHLEDNFMLYDLHKELDTYKEPFEAFMEWLEQQNIADESVFRLIKWYKRFKKEC